MLAKQITIQGNEYHFPNGNIYSIPLDNILNPLGAGMYGIIYKACNEKGRESIIKRIRKLSSQDGMPTDNIEAQICNLHPEFQCKMESYGEDDKDYYIAMPFYDQGTLTQLIYDNKIPSQKHAFEYFRKICYGTRCLSQETSYSCLTTDDIRVFTSTKNSQHYSFAVSMNTKKYNAEISLKEHFTMAPEMLEGKHNARMSIYSLGCIFYKMLTGKEPFEASTAEEVNNLKKQNIVNVDSKWMLSGLVLMILEGCLQYSYFKRLSTGQLFSALNIVIPYREYVPKELDEIDINQIISYLDGKRMPRQSKNKVGMAVNEFKFPLRRKSRCGYITKILAVILVIILVVYYLLNRDNQQIDSGQITDRLNPKLDKIKIKRPRKAEKLIKNALQ